MKYLPIIILLALLSCKKNQVVTTIPTTVVTKPPVCGCTDPNALNFDPRAEKDDSSCKHEYDDIVGTWDFNLIDTLTKEFTSPQITYQHYIVEIYKYGNDKNTVRIKTTMPNGDSFYIYKNSSLELFRAEVSRTYENKEIYYTSNKPQQNFFLSLINKNEFKYQSFESNSCPGPGEYILYGNGKGKRIK